LKKGDEDDEDGEKTTFGTPRYLPMVIPPLPWTPTQCGGYLSQRTDLLRYRSPSQLQFYLVQIFPPYHNSLNYLGSIPGRLINLSLMS